MKKAVKVLLGLTAAALVLAAGCSKPATASKSTVKTIVYGTTDKVSDMDPASAYDIHTWDVFQNIDKGLLAYTPGTTDIVPGLASTYDVNPAGDEFTFHLRPNLKFTDGTPRITSYNVCYTKLLRAGRGEAAL